MTADLEAPLPKSNPPARVTGQADYHGTAQMYHKCTANETRLPWPSTNLAGAPAIRLDYYGSGRRFIAIIGVSHSVRT